MEPRSVKLAECSIGTEEIEAVVEVLKSGALTSGERVQAFERAFASQYGFEHCAVVNSGSSANLLAVAALRDRAWPRRREGDPARVIVPAVTWPTSVWPIAQLGLTPLVVDVDPATWCLDPSRAREAAEMPGVVGALPVHVYGNPCDLSWVNRFVVLEDCCEALGSSRSARFVGHVGACATFSFYFSHHVTTIEGGAVCADDDEFDARIRLLRAHGWARDLGAAKARALYERAGVDAAIDPAFVFYAMGYNFRMTEVQAAIGLVQLRKAVRFDAVRKAAWQMYRERLGEFEDVLAFQEPTAYSEPSWFGFGMRVRENATFSRTALRGYLLDRGIESRPIIAGNIARQPGARGVVEVFGDLPAADAICGHAFSIGCHPSITPDDVDYVYDVFRNFLSRRRT